MQIRVTPPSAMPPSPVPLLAVSPATVFPVPSRSRFSIVLGHVMLTLSILLIGVGARENGMNADDLLYGLSVAASGLFAWCFWSWWSFTRSLFDPYSLFLLSACLFNGGSYLLEACGVSSQHWWNGHHGTELVTTTLFLVVLGIGACHLGALLVAMKQPRLGGTDVTFSQVAPQDLLLVGTLLVLISIVPTFVQLKGNIALVHSAGYEGLYQQSRHQGLQSTTAIIAAFLMPGVMLMLAGSRRNLAILAVTAVLLMAHALGVVLTGRRSDALIPILGYLWVYNSCVRRIPRSFLVTAMVIGLVVVFPLISLVRHRSLDKNLSTESLSRAYGTINNPLESQIDQMGFSASTIADTLRLVPATRYYDGGAVYLNALSSVIPNLLNPVDLQAQYGGTPEVWLMKAEHPSFAAKGLYFGYSFIAEAYLAFGWVGAPFALLVIGALIARLAFWAVQLGSPARIAVTGAFIVPLLHFARGHSLEVVRPFVWYSLVPYGLVILVGAWRMHRSRKSAWAQSASTYEARKVQNAN